MLKDYYYLTKPGIIRGNTLNAIGAFLLASTGRIDFWLLLATLTGTALIIASACVFNNYLDRHIDAKMKRTSKRALASGRISTLNALVYGTVLGLLGILILSVFTNALTVYLGVAAHFLYVFVYGYFKRQTPLGTLIGTVPGAIPPVAGYTAVTGQIDKAAGLIFLILFFWQMAHFYAIAMFRLKDYKAAGIPVLPVVRGMKRAQISILIHITGFVLACAMLTLYGYTGYVFMIVMCGLGIAWILLGIRAINSSDQVNWGRRMFLFSLTIILALAVMFSVGARVP